MIRYISFVLLIFRYRTIKWKSPDQNKGNNCSYVRINAKKNVQSASQPELKRSKLAVNSLWIRGQKPVTQKVGLKIIFQTKEIKYHIEYGLNSESWALLFSKWTVAYQLFVVNVFKLRSHCFPIGWFRIHVWLVRHIFIRFRLRGEKLRRHWKIMRNFQWKKKSELNKFGIKCF